MNLFSTLPLPEELQLRLSEMVTAPPVVAPYYATGTWTPVVTNEPGTTAIVVRKSFVRFGIGPSAASGDTVILDLMINFSCIGDVIPGCVLTLPTGFTIGLDGAIAQVTGYDQADESPYSPFCSAGESIPGSIELYLTGSTGGNKNITLAIRILYRVA